MKVTVPLKYLVDASRPITYGIVQAGPDFPGGVPYIRPVDMTSAQGVPDEAALQRTTASIAAAYRRSTVATGDVVISIGPSYGKIMVVPASLAGANLTQGTARIAPADGIETRFLYWALQSHLARQHWDASVGGATFRALNLEPLAKTPVPLLPRDEQRRIADFLDSQVALLDRALTLRQQQMNLLDEQFEARREELIEHSRVALRIPLGLLIDSSRPINYGVLMPGPRLEEGVPLIEAGDVMRGPILVPDLRLTAPDIEREFRRSRLVPGDLVMAIRGSTGRIQVVPDGPEVMNVTRDAARIAVDGSLATARYIRHALSTRYSQDWLSLRVTGSAVKGINIGDLRKVPVSVLPVEIQHNVADQLDNAERVLTRARRLLADSLALLAERKQALITAAVTGQFDVTTARSVA